MNPDRRRRLIEGHKRQAKLAAARKRQRKARLNRLLNPRCCQ